MTKMIKFYKFAFLLMLLFPVLGCSNDDEKEESSSWAEHITSCFECNVVSIDEPNSLVFASVNIENEADTTTLPRTIKFKASDCPGHRFKLGEALRMRIVMIWVDPHGMPVVVPFCKVKVYE